MGGGTKMFKLPIMVALLATSSHLAAVWMPPEGHRIRTKDAPIPPGDPRGFWSRVSGTRVKDQISEHKLLLVLVSPKILPGF